MPLILCPDCKKQISDKSDKCVHCGCPIQAPGQSAEMHQKVKLPLQDKEEVVYYHDKDILVSSKTVKIRNRTFNPGSITSVSASQMTNPVAVATKIKITVYTMLAIGFALPGLLFLIAALYPPISFIWFIPAAIFGGIAVYSIRIIGPAKKELENFVPWGRLNFDTSSGRVKDIIENDYRLVVKVKSSIDKMIADKN